MARVCLLFFLIGVADAAAQIEVVTSEVDAEPLSEGVVKITWKAELKNSGTAEATVTVTLSLNNADGETLKSLSIEEFVVPGGATRTAVQVRPISSANWSKASDHSISIE